MVADTNIVNGMIVTSKSKFEGDIVINNGKIVSVGTDISLPESQRTINASGKIVMPGIVDPHVHIDEQPESRAGTYHAETRAAALGGVTTFIDFAFQGGNRAMSDPDAGLVDGIQNKIDNETNAYVDYSLHGVLHREEPETCEEIPLAIDKGVTSFKMFLSNYQIGVSNGFILLALKRLAEEDAVALLHAEDPSICDSLTEELKRQGKSEPEDYPDSRPPLTEAAAVDDILRMVRETGVKYYGVHTTCREAAEVINKYQQDISHVRAETCTHYTAADRSLHETMSNLPKIAPPLRSEDDVEAMFEHLEKGTLSVVSTDHSVYHKEYKEVENWWDSPFGANSIQTSLPVFHEEAVQKRDYSYSFLVDVMCTTPANTFGMPNKGTLDPGTDADIVIFDANQSYTIDATENESNSEYSIYDGRTVRGAVEKTFLRGNLVADKGDIVIDNPPGRFIDRNLPSWTQ